ncbi:MAG: hypothetical protein K6B65_01625, partial [Bacilli bacterium]|nr:hypothetical protein [Bacilli bacterium]
MEIKKTSFDGVTYFSLKNKVGLELTVCEIGASIYEVKYRGKVMTLTPVDKSHFYSSGLKYGKSVGPIAGRIKNGEIEVDGKPVTLPHNEGNNTCHSGLASFDSRCFKAEVIEEIGQTCIRFSLHYEANEYYPNNVDFVIDYILLEEEATFKIVTKATPELTSPINVVNHSYFVLGEGDILSSKLYIDADNVATYDEDLLIKGIAKVDEVTDFKDLKPIAKFIDEPCLMGSKLKGYDHCYYLNRRDGVKLMMQSPEFVLELDTTAPAIQIYSSNYAEEEGLLDSGYPIHPRCGLAIEPCSYQGNLKAMEVEGGSTREIETSYHFVSRSDFREASAEMAVASLIEFFAIHDLIEEENRTYLHNMVLHHLRLPSPYTGKLDRTHLKSMMVPEDILPPIKNRLLELGYEEEEASRELAFILGLITPSPKEVMERFKEIYKTSSVDATEYLYGLCLRNGYVEKEKVDRNIFYRARFHDGPEIETSINLSKPEKDNREIAKALTQKPSGYPPCVLCYENIGFGGDETRAPRGNLRFVPVILRGRKWYLQYSPYGYFDRHCILFSEEHCPMEISEEIFLSLLEFTDRFPHYFIGSNSDMPIVGGSILNHEHFQGGKEILPLLRAPIKRKIETSDYGAELFEVDFY